MLTIRYQSRFKRDFKRILKRGYDIHLLETVVEMLAEEKPLPPEYKDHDLQGKHKGYRECHITPDWLLIYEVRDDQLLLYLTRTCTHTDLFGI